MEKMYITIVLLIYLQWGMNINQFVFSEEVSNKELAEVKSVAEAIDIAESYFREAYLSPVNRQAMLKSCGDEYFKRAHEILNQEKSALLLKEGWHRNRWSLNSKQALEMLEEGLRLNPNNPVAYYKVADTKERIYKSSLPRQTKHPQRREVLPNGTIINLEPTYVSYSEDYDNTLLEQAQQLAEKAIQLDSTFANGYELLSRLYRFKGEEEKANYYNFLFLKNKEYFNLELVYYNENYVKYNLIPAAISMLKNRAQEKYEELVEQNIIGPEDEEYRADYQHSEDQ